MKSQPEQHPGESFVKVQIDDRTVELHRGSHQVTELKQLLGVDPTYVLDIDMNGTLTPLPDGDRFTVKGEEVFFSHPRTGTSS